MNDAYIVNYITAPKLYNTGFIPPSSTQLRMKQDLYPQTIASLCQYATPEAISNVATPGYHDSLYPIHFISPDYGPGSVPNDCQCLQYIQPP
jgi:hypothetical protein